MRVITSVFRYRDGQEVSVDERTVAAGVHVAERHDLVATEIREARAESQAGDRSAFVWVKVADPSREELEFFRDLLDLPQLQIEDAALPRQRPKVELEASGAFVVLKELRYEEERSAVETGQVAVFLGQGYAVSIRHGDAAPGSARQAVRRHLALTRQGPVSVLWAVVDVIVDGYLDIVGHLGQDIEAVEETVFSESRQDHAGLIYNLKRENLEVRRAVAPIAEQARVLAQERGQNIPQPLVAFFRDVGDHVMRAYDLVETYDQLLMTMLMAATSQQDLRQNQDMRKISAWAAIIAVPTAIAGVYGMNFDDMPELHWRLGYPMVLGAMVVVCFVLHRLFKRSGWL